MRCIMAKPLQRCKMSTVTVSVSVSCFLVSGSAAEQVSFETRLILQRLKIPGSSFLAAGSMPVVQPWWKNVLRNLSQSGQRRGHHTWTIIVHFCHWQLTHADKSLQGTVVQDHIEPCRPADRVCIVSSVQHATNETDHTAHDWCDQTYSVNVNVNVNLYSV